MKADRAIETQRLTIRPFTKGDADYCRSLWCDRENGRYLSDPAADTADGEYLEVFDGMEDAEDGLYFVALLRDGGVPVGTCCAFPEDGVWDVGYCVQASRWRQGLGSELLRGLTDWIRDRGGLAVTAEVADENAASRALLRKFGFREYKKTHFKKRGEERWFESHVFRLKL